MSALYSLEDILSQRASRKAAWMAAEAAKRVTVAIESVYPPGSIELTAFDERGYRARLEEEIHADLVAKAYNRIASEAIGEVE